MRRFAPLVFAMLASAPLAVSASPEPLSLAEALDTAARANEAPRIAAARLDQARAQSREAYALLLPRLALTGTYTRRAREVVRSVGGVEATLQAQNALSTNASVQASLFDASAFPLIGRAERLVDATALDAGEVRRDLAHDVAESFFAVLSAEQLGAAAERRLIVARAVVADAEARLRAGLGSRNELTRSQLELASAELARTRAANGAVLARLTLGFLMDVELGSRPLEQPPATPAPGGDDAALIQAAIEARRDLKAQETRAEAARLFAREPWLRLVPSLGAAATWRANNEPGLSGQSTDWNASLTLTWALYDGGIRYAQAAARAAEHQQARLGADVLRRRIALEIRSAMADLETAQASLGQAEARESFARQNAEEVQARFALGLATGLERADATVSEFEAAAELARQRFALRVAQLSLLRGLGRWPVEP